MTKQDFKQLQCPYCLSPFKVFSFQEKERQVIFGTLVCQCEEFPVVDGIVILRKEGIKKIVHALQAQRFSEAVWMAFDSKVGHILARSRIFSNLALVIYQYIVTEVPGEWVKFMLKLLYPRDSMDYFLQRQREGESLLFFTPLLVVAKPRSWLNFGAGIHNYYRELNDIVAKCTIFSIEQNYLYTWLSVRLFPAARVVYIVGDMSLGKMTRKPVDVITGIDALPFLTRQRQVLTNITQTQQLTEQGVVVLSSIPEHLYLPLNSYTYPLARKNIKKWIDLSVRFFKDETLLSVLKDELALRKVHREIGPKVFRYTVVCTYEPLPQTTFKLPKNLQALGWQSWTSAPQTWSNQVY